MTHKKLNDKYQQDKANTVWNNPHANPETMGVHPLGTDNSIEIPYRHYYELQTLKQFLPQKPFSCIEFGCGAGRWAFALAGQVTTYTGVDISKPQLDFAQKHADMKGLSHLRFVEANAASYAFDATYDVIYDGGCTQYMHDKQCDELIQKSAAHLNEGGVLVLRATVVVSPEERYIMDTKSYISIYRTEEELVRMAYRHNFKLKHATQTYLYLQDKASWQKPELCAFVRLGMQLFPDETFALMKEYSKLFYDKPESRRTVEGRDFVHKFFIFHKKN